MSRGFFRVFELAAGLLILLLALQSVAETNGRTEAGYSQASIACSDLLLHWMRGHDDLEAWIPLLLPEKNVEIASEEPIPVNEHSVVCHSTRHLNGSEESLFIQIEW